MKQLLYSVFVLLIIVMTGCSGGGNTGSSGNDGYELSSFLPVPTPSPSISITPSPSPSTSPSISPEPSPSISPTPIPTPTISPIPSPSPSPSPTPDQGGGGGGGGYVPPAPPPEPSPKIFYNYGWKAINLKGVSHPYYTDLTGQQNKGSEGVNVNNVAVSNYGTDLTTVDLYDIDGNLLETIDESLILSGIAAAGNEMNNFILSQANDSIVQFSINWTSPFAVKTEVSGSLIGLYDIAANAEHIAVLCRIGTIMKILVWNRYFIEEENFSWTYEGWNFPTSIALDKDDKLYISDTLNHRVMVFDHNGGEPLLIFGSEGTINGKFKNPTGIDVDDNYIYVCDLRNYRIQVFLKDGTFQAVFGEKGDGDGQFNAPFGICSDRETRIFVTDAINNVLQCFIRKE